MSMFVNWLQVFVQQDMNFALDNITTHAGFDYVFEKNTQKWRSLLVTDNPDLSGFRNSSGKMLTYHGLVWSLPLAH